MTSLTSRRALLTTAALLPVAACATATTPSTSTSPTLSLANIAADTTMFANALAALLPLIPNTSAAVIAQVDQGAQLVASIATSIASAASTTAVASGKLVISTVSSIAQAVLGLFPGGGTAVTIANAVLGLLPEFTALLGISGGVAAPVGVTPNAAKATLAMLPKSKYLP